MGNRACPLCFGKVPRTLVLTRSEGLECPSCHTNLELSRPIRALSAAVGLVVGFALALWVAKTRIRGEWILALLAGFFGYGLASALALLFISDLAVQPKAVAGHFPQAHA